MKLSSIFDFPTSPSLIRFRQALNHYLTIIICRDKAKICVFDPKCQKQICQITDFWSQTLKLWNYHLFLISLYPRHQYAFNEPSNTTVPLLFDEIRQQNDFDPKCPNMPKTDFGPRPQNYEIIIIFDFPTSASLIRFQQALSNYRTIIICRDKAKRCVFDPKCPYMPKNGFLVAEPKIMKLLSIFDCPISPSLIHVQRALVHYRTIIICRDKAKNVFSTPNAQIWVGVGGEGVGCGWVWGDANNVRGWGW